MRVEIEFTLVILWLLFVIGGTLRAAYCIFRAVYLIRQYGEVASEKCDKYADESIILGLLITIVLITS